MLISIVVVGASREPFKCINMDSATQLSNWHVMNTLLLFDNSRKMRRMVQGDPTRLSQVIFSDGLKLSKSAITQ